MLYLYIILYYYFIYISLEYEININSLDIPSDLVYEGPFENKNELESSCGHSGQSQLDTTTHYVSYKCTKDSECLYNKCVNNYCVFSSTASVEYCSNIYHYLAMFEYAYIHCGKAPYIPCENDEECSSKNCKRNSCVSLIYDLHKISLSKQVQTGEILIFLSVPFTIYCCFYCCYRRYKKEKFTKIQNN
ncbi:hypothetical protein LY90DRAFT_507516 [Neocallimastix californiae]|uniref:Uncharacterized protein n=1 Tax=Neocallimastix californiae TaxID=1754190 RepID=A0A1Y2D5R7_9FUNG|nr:hypothetical protein LY90DRAFT_507516 [Neocallimastix californiae]|eukprot:ORY54494.1 hypothetical protein LY90DRAFT_507516 [Neocallimastix californiae]